ncbi:uncharacterized protein BDCG_00443 [Blastomyces dermatitidis ER-3]|uniref:Uncharacterized protein n=1 Tax=Ajellomyces dermatitidis (strain ER-3 / ATCC MYA-2586) TaxID=559297 RepID=A0ABP2EKE8_AJEDR|nr:uncharacterized protein BDCG_00443 [Blastomyces dermatitidis ER-3]EEQ83638.2 hypothetical protein BDCG_00443 [Blastomyces dermatitidis ER-3]
MKHILGTVVLWLRVYVSCNYSYIRKGVFKVGWLDARWLSTETLARTPAPDWRAGRASTAQRSQVPAQTLSIYPIGAFPKIPLLAAPAAPSQDGLSFPWLQSPTSPPSCLPPPLQ